MRACVDADKRPGGRFSHYHSPSNGWRCADRAHCLVEQNRAGRIFRQDVYRKYWAVVPSPVKSCEEDLATRE
jgi:hypothetical protein